jgi:hypothetical protein
MAKSLRGEGQNDVGRENEDLANVMLTRIQTGVASGQS